jgi:hypothetical protein
MKYSYIVTDIIYFLGFLAIFILIFFTKPKLDQVQIEYTSSVIKNWNLSPIVDIQLGVNCTLGYSRLVLDTWNGTVTGCLCSTYVRTGMCSSKSGCKTLSPNGPVNFTSWYGSSLCVKRLPVNSYFDLTIVKSGNSCPMNQKNCGIIDTLNNSLCVPNDSTCPINDIQVQSVDQIIPTGYKTLDLTQGGVSKRLVFGNKGPSGKVLVEFKISDNTPCIDPKFSNVVSNFHLLEYNSVFDLCYRAVNQKVVDRSYQFIDVYNKYKLYVDNGIFQIIQKLPFYSGSTASNIDTRLYYRNYVGMQISYFDTIKSKNSFGNIYRGISYSFENFYSYSGLFNSIYIVVIILWSMNLLLFHLIRYVTKCTIDLETHEPYYEDIASLLMEIFSFLMIFTLTILFIVSYSQFSRLKENYSDLNPYIYGGDENFNELVPLFVENLNNSCSLILIKMIISIIIFLLPFTDLVIYSIFIYDKDSHEVNYGNRNPVIGINTRNEISPHSVINNLYMNNNNNQEDNLGPAELEKNYTKKEPSIDFKRNDNIENSICF